MKTIEFVFFNSYRITSDLFDTKRIFNSVFSNNTYISRVWLVFDIFNECAARVKDIKILATRVNQ